MKQAMDLKNGLINILALPRGEQAGALKAWRAALPGLDDSEAWNTRFTGDSLYDAWSSFSVMSRLYAANKAVIRERLDAAGPGWRIVEMGGGNGRLWSEVLQPEDQGELVLIDPVAHVHDVVAARLPEGVTLVSRVAIAQDALPLPDADVFVTSLTLHHVPGWDASELASHGMTGIGKLEILQAVADCLRARNGVGLINEADVYCDLALQSGNEVLINNLIDSYVRRTAMTLLRDIETRQVDEDLKRRWLAIVRLWCLDQIDMGDKPLAERDVFELNVQDWLKLIAQAGLRLKSHQFTDTACLFHQYVFEI